MASLSLLLASLLCSLKFRKIHRKTPVPETLFYKVAGLRNFIKKESLAQVFFYEFCEISKNTFSYRTPPVVTSVTLQLPTLLKK